MVVPFWCRLTQVALEKRLVTMNIRGKYDTRYYID